MNIPTLDIVFPDRHTNPILIEMFKLIKFRQQHQLVKNKTYCEKHHIIPRCFSKYHGYDIDNSAENIVYLSYIEHVKIHIYLKDYFLAKHDYNVGFANAKAITYMLGKNKSSIHELTQADEQWLNNIAEQNKPFNKAATQHQIQKMSDAEKIQFRKACSEASKKFWQNATDSYRKEFGKTVSNALLSRTQEEKDLQYQHMLETKANWDTDMKNYIKQLTSELSLSVWNSYDEDQYNARCTNISIGTKKAMAKLSPEKKAEMAKKAGINWKKAYAKKSQQEKNKINKKKAKYHLDSKAMSNDLTHHWRYVAAKDQQAYLEKGYVFGNHVKIWLEQGLVKLKPGYYG